MNRRIMTVDELYSFCLKNNFSRFDSKEFGKELVVEMPANFEKSENETDKMTEGMTPFVSRAFHDHVNLNKSEIKEQDFKDNLPSSHLRPILANIVKDEETGELDFGSHDSHIEEVIETDENGKEFTVEKIVYDEQPIGVIDGSKTSIEYDEETKVNRAVLHGYLYNEYCQDAIDILNRRGTISCSVELVIREMSMDMKNKTLVLNDFYVSGLTLLSAKTKPGMAGSNFKIEDFSLKEKSLDFESKLIEMQEKLEELEAHFNINNTIRKEETRVEMNENFEEVTETEKVTETEATTDEVTVSEEESEKTIDETSEEVTVEETEKSVEIETETEEVTETEEITDDPIAKEDEACGGGGSGSAKKKKKNSKDELFNELFEISFDEIRYALNALCSIYRNDSEWCYVSQVYEDYFIMEDWDSNKYYKQSYTKDGDNVSLSGERIEMFAMLLTESEKLSIEEMRSNYSSIVEQLNTYKSEKDFADKMTVFDDDAYADYLDTEEFKALMSKESVNQYSKEQLSEKADATLGKLVKKNKTFSYSEKTEKQPTVVFMSNSNSDKESKKKTPYGGIFDKYNK